MFSISSVFSLAAALAVAVPAAATPQAATRELRVCADPNNLPFSNRAGQGFENELARLVGRELGEPVRYTWWPQRRGFIRNTLKAGKCDLVMGVPSGFDLAQTTRPYYRSTYVFVTRSDRHLKIKSLDDPILRKLRIGVQVVGDDYSNPPAAQALAKRGIVRNVVGYTVYGDYSKPHPPSSVIDAVANGAVDVAIAWGPMAGYFAQRASVPLKVTPVSPQIDLPFIPFVFDIAMAVRREDPSLRDSIEKILERRQPEVNAILRKYGVPLVDEGGQP